MKHSWRAEYKQLHGEYVKQKFPEYARASPNDEVLIPSERKANGLTQLIIKWLTWKGHYANRISTQGQASVAKIPKADLNGRIHHFEQIRWTKGNTKRGTPDITAILYGKSVWIEVKVGKDEMSKAQEKQQFDIQQAGGLYFVARDMQSFVDWYYKLIEAPGEDPDFYTTPEGYE